MHSRDHFSLLVDARDFSDPAGRGRRYAHAAYTPENVTALRCWLHYSHFGDISGDWADLGVPPGPGQALHVLFESGQTATLVVRHFPNAERPLQYFLMVPHAPGKLFKVYHIRPSGKEVVWPYRVVPWTDRTTAIGLLDTVVSIWPRLQNQHMAAITEPLRVVSLYIRDKDRIGLGLTQHTSAQVMAPAPDHTWRPQEAFRVPDKAPARYVTAEEALRPPLVLWGMENKTQDYLAVLTQPKDEEDDRWSCVRTEYSGCRLLQFAPEGGDPSLWGKAAKAYGPVPSVDGVLLGETPPPPTLGPVPYGLPVADLKRLHGAWWCQRCLAESGGLDKVRAVENGLCVLHLQLERRTPKAKLLHGVTCPESPNGKHRWVRPEGSPPYCFYGCAVHPSSSVVRS